MHSHVCTLLRLLLPFLNATRTIPPSLWLRRQADAGKMKPFYWTLQYKTHQSTLSRLHFSAIYLHRLGQGCMKGYYAAMNAATLGHAMSTVEEPICWICNKIVTKSLCTNMTYSPVKKAGAKFPSPQHRDEHKYVILPLGNCKNLPEQQLQSSISCISPNSITPTFNETSLQGKWWT